MMRKVALIGAVGGTLYGGLAAGLMYQSSNEKAEVEKGDAKDKVFIVTGANSGIGREIAHQLARERGKVIMACRDMSKCEEERQKIVLDTRNKYVYCRQCDLASFQSIKDFVAQFNKQVTINTIEIIRLEIWSLEPHAFIFRGITWSWVICSSTSYTLIQEDICYRRKSAMH